MSRTALLVICILFAGGCSPRESAERFVAVDTLDPATRACFARVTRAYHVDVRVRGQCVEQTSVFGKAVYERALPNEVARCAPVLASELDRYPAEFIRKCKLRQIILSGAMRTGNALSGGISFPDDGTIDLYIAPDPPNPFKRMPLAEWRSTLHHELFHQFEDHQVGFVTKLRWNATNDPSFKYGQRSKRSARLIEPSPADWLRTPGFVSDYAEESAEEDRAELFASLMMNYAALGLLAERDRIVKAKIERAKSMLRRHCADMDDAFWVRVSGYSAESANPLSVALQHGWIRIVPGSDPADASDSRTAEWLLRPTRCGGYYATGFGSGGVTITDASMEQLFCFAYDCRTSRIYAPADMDSARYDLIVPAAKGERLTELKQAARGRLQRLFGMTATIQTRMVSVLVLTRLPETRSSFSSVATQPSLQMVGSVYFRDQWPQANRRELTLEGASPAVLAAVIEDRCEEVGLPVLEELGTECRLTGRVSYEPGDLESLRGGLRGQLGLALEPATRPVEVLILKRVGIGR